MTISDVNTEPLAVAYENVRVKHLLGLHLANHAKERGSVMKSMKFGKVLIDNVCVSSMGGSQPNPTVLSPEGKTSTKQMKIFFFFHLLNVVLLHCLEVSLVMTW